MMGLLLINHVFFMVLRIARLNHVIRLTGYGFLFDDIIKCGGVSNFLNIWGYVISSLCLSLKLCNLGQGQG